MDLHPTEGWFQSTKKIIQVTDTNGKSYVVTVEEGPELWFEDVDQATLDAEA
jgi:hypothetical protein